MRDLLLIEDNPVFAIVVERAMAGAPRWRVTTASSLREGFDLLDERPFEVVLLDLGLPDSGGRASYSAMRDHIEDLPVVVLTNQREERLGRELVRAGASDFLDKRSITDEAIVWAVEAAAERGEFRRELNEHRHRASIQNERRRIARELHDRVIQRLFATALELEQCESGSLGPTEAEALSVARRSIDAAVRDLRFAVDQLHRQEICSLSEESHKVCADLRHASQRDIVLSIRGDVDGVDPTFGEALLPVLREGVVNAIRHGEGRVTVDMTADRELRLHITNASAAGSPPGSGVGLSSMEERAGQLGGSSAFVIRSGRAHLEWRIPLADGVAA